MTAAVRVLRCPSAHDLTDALLAQARDAARRDPGSVLWLVPHPRAGNDLRHRLTAAGTRGVCGLRILTFADLAQLALDTPATLSAAQRRLLAEEIAADLTARGELTH